MTLRVTTASIYKLLLAVILQFNLSTQLFAEKILDDWGSHEGKINSGLMKISVFGVVITRIVFDNTTALID